MIAAEKVLEREFSAGKMKEAYLQCCKWVSSNIIAKNNCRNVTYRIEKLHSGMWEPQKVKLTVYVMCDEDEVMERHCEICKEVSGNFYMSQNKYMCNSCKMPPYRRRVQERLRMLKDSLKGVIL